MSDSDLIDWEQLEMIFGEDEEDFDDDMAELFQEFLEDAQSNFSAIEDASFGSDKEAIAKLSHKVKGSASNFGFSKVASILAHIENDMATLTEADYNHSLLEVESCFEASSIEVRNRYPGVMIS